jgi:hypothetical protein
MPEPTRYAVNPETGEVKGFNPPVNVHDAIRQGWRFATESEIEAHLNPPQEETQPVDTAETDTDTLVAESREVDLYSMSKPELIDYATERLGMKVDGRLTKQRLIEEILDVAYKSINSETT